MKPIIEVKNLSKKYTIGGVQLLNKTFREAIISSISAQKKESFYALKDINFDIYPGDTLGIIGKNGAGKSTLLKILSRITFPTEGKVITRGSISSLLEVGTGFHSELTGRENIFLNGSILGMKRQEIIQHFDEIVDFSGVEKFIDTPIKHYSSGMQMRLAFAVAAHLNPDVLIIDEVLAVGDTEFQKKCILKMEDISNSGNTLIFVSHNLATVQNLCKKSLVLEKGKIAGFGPTADQIKYYLQQSGSGSDKSNEPQVLTQGLTLTQFSFSSKTIYTSDPLEFTIELALEPDSPIYSIGILFYDIYEQRIAIVDLRRHDMVYKTSEGKFRLKGIIHNIPFVEGEYSIGMFVQTDFVSDNFFNLDKISVLFRSPEINKLSPYPAEVRGFVELNHSFIND